MRRNRRRPMDGLFYNTGDMYERTVNDSINVSRGYTDSLQEQMYEQERMTHKKEEDEINRQQQSPTPVVKSTIDPGTNPGQNCL